MSILETHSKELKKACDQYRVKSLYAFGSVLSDHFTEESDIDLLVEFNRDSYEGAFEQYFGFKEELERIFSRNVDLVCYRAIRNPYFKQEVDGTKRELYAA